MKTNVEKMVDHIVLIIRQSKEFPKSGSDVVIQLDNIDVEKCDKLKKLFSDFETKPRYIKEGDYYTVMLAGTTFNFVKGDSYKAYIVKKVDVEFDKIEGLGIPYLKTNSNLASLSSCDFEMFQQKTGMDFIETIKSLDTKEFASLFLVYLLSNCPGLKAEFNGKTSSQENVSVIRELYTLFEDLNGFGFYRHYADFLNIWPEYRVIVNDILSTVNEVLE